MNEQTILGRARGEKIGRRHYSMDGSSLGWRKITITLIDPAKGFQVRSACSCAACLTATALAYFEPCRR